MLPQPPDISTLLLMTRSPPIYVSPFTELIVNTSLAAPPSHPLETIKLLVVCESVVLTWNTSPISYTSGSTSGALAALLMIT